MKHREQKKKCLQSARRKYVLDNEYKEESNIFFEKGSICNVYSIKENL